MHNCFPFTLSIKKFHTKTPYESRMCTVDWFYDRWTEYDETWQNLMPSAKYFWRSDIMSWHLIGWDILLHLTDGSSALLSLCVVRISPYVRLTFLTSPKRWTEFEETLQEARNHYPLPMFVFFGQIKQNYGRLGLWLAETYSTSPLQQTLLRYRADIIDLDIHIAIFL